MGGKISVSSKVGKGSLFSVELAMGVDNLATLNDQPAPATLKPHRLKNSAKCTLLYVEDNPANLALVEDIIATRPDFLLLSARDGFAGIELARLAQPDLILMDINLPGMSGTDALKVIAKDPLTKHIPVIALSANAIPRDVEKGLEAGFFRYLTKPIRINELMSALDAALELTPTKMTTVKKEERA
jgi:CheY-like chemotaxis protein